MFGTLKRKRNNAIEIKFKIVHTVLIRRFNIGEITIQRPPKKNIKEIPDTSFTFGPYVLGNLK